MEIIQQRNINNNNKKNNKENRKDYKIHRMLLQLWNLQLMNRQLVAKIMEWNKKIILFGVKKKREIKNFENTNYIYINLK